MRRVVVTGMGIVSSIGNTTQEVLASLREAKSGVTRADKYAELGFRSQVQGARPQIDIFRRDSVPEDGPPGSDLDLMREQLLDRHGIRHAVLHPVREVLRAPSSGSLGAAIARALMSEPRILLADEPTGNLDAETGRQIMDLLEKLHREQGQTIVMVTHDRALAREADRVLVLKSGRLEKAEG